MKKRVISWLLTVVMVVSLLPTSVLADTLAADQEQQTQQEQIAPVDTENTVPAGNEETQEQQEPAPETPASQMARSGGADSAPTAINDADGFKNMVAGGSYTLTKDIIVTEPYASDFSGTFDGDGHTVTLKITANTNYVGLFSKLAGGAVVKNVITAGTVTATGKNNVGGIAGVARDSVFSIIIPVGAWRNRTPVSTLFTFCPPAPPLRKVSQLMSAGLIVISIVSSTAG